jgi:serine/threonine protein kinase
MQLSPGDKLGPYEILASIGAGGMGEVYRARDTRLNRDVAIKVSGAQFSDRFEREAKAIAALNHPNICQIYDIASNYLVMEYIDGAPIVSLNAPRLLLRLRPYGSRHKSLQHSKPRTLRGLFIETSNQRTSSRPRAAL